PRSDPAIREAVASLASSDLLVIVAGLTVPGHYRGGTPLSLTELQSIVRRTSAQSTFGGPIRHGYTLTGGTAALPWFPASPNVPSHSPAALSPALLAPGNLEDFVAAWLDGAPLPPPQPDDPYRSLATLAPAGAELVRQHPDFPHVIVEIETARGCERSVHCSFCTEGLLGSARFRPMEDIVAEIEALYASGVRHFRLGKQPNLFAWPGRRSVAGEPIPAPVEVERLYRAIRRAAPELRTLHLDNVNPGFVSAFPDQCVEIAGTIASLNTPGDVAALGLESADSAVLAANSLKATPRQTLEAIRILNRAGAHRSGPSLPHLLPGVNLLYGLPGETAATYERNFAFLFEVAAEGLLLRRINVRQVMAFPGTPLHDLSGGAPPRINKQRFQKWKQRIQEEIERPMLRRVAPVGTVLSGLVTEFHDGDVTFGRQLASYPLLVGLPLRLPLRSVLDVVVVDHGYRSVTALPFPIPINSLPDKALAALPGIGKKRAARLVAARPFRTVEEALAALDEPAVLAPYVGLLCLGPAA
ncbi:MAG: radical SAM protein, partial [Deltaproteobacteria bacterium]|nr:radical SAM protein [Deltaproteobacteria bacterium]